MLDFVTIENIAARAASGRVKEAGLERVVAQPAIDSEGNDALRITLVLKPQAVDALSGDEALDLLVDLKGSLQAAGEERLPIVEYATEAEMMEEAEEAREAARQEAELGSDESDAN